MADFDFGQVVIQYEDSSSCRLVCIKADDLIALEAYVPCRLDSKLLNSFRREHAFVAPTLARNITGQTNTLENPRIRIYSTPFGSRSPTIPTARTLTIARVASPVSVDRTYQPLSLFALHEYFQSGLRLVKNGDIIA